jgi:hypothetical protein
MAIRRFRVCFGRNTARLTVCRLQNACPSCCVQVTECVSVLLCAGYRMCVRLVVCRLQNLCPSCCLVRPPRCTGALLPTQLWQMAQQLLQICHKSTSLENKSFKTVLQMTVLGLLKIYCIASGGELRYIALCRLES